MSEKVFVNYIYDSCYSLSCGDYFLVFDYAKGILDIPESKHVIFFVTDKGGESYTEEIFNLGSLKSLNYVINKNICDLKYKDNIIYLNKDEFGMKELKKLYNRNNVYLLDEDDSLCLNFGLDDVFIKTFSLDGDKIGYLIEFDSILIFYGGSLNLDRVDDERYLDLIDELEIENPDIIFLPIDDLTKSSLAYLDKLISSSESQIFFPTKIGDKEELSFNFKKNYKAISTDIMSIYEANERIEIEINWRPESSNIN